MLNSVEKLTVYMSAKNPVVFAARTRQDVLEVLSGWITDKFLNGNWRQLDSLTSYLYDGSISLVFDNYWGVVYAIPDHEETIVYSSYAAARDAFVRLLAVFGEWDYGRNV